MHQTVQSSIGVDGSPCEPASEFARLPSVVDVFVAGFGPVGAALTNLLAAYGLQVLVIDREREIHMSPRAIALDNEALRILQYLGMTERDLETVAIPHVSMRSPFFGEFGRANTMGSQDGHPKLVTFYQPQLERRLREMLAGRSNVHIGTGVALENYVAGQDEVIATIKTAAGERHSVRARYLIGADGASSLVRKLSGQEFVGKTFAEDWLVVDARNVPRPIDHVEFICDYRRPTPHMVAPGGRERWEFMLRRGETREEMESDERIRELLAPWGSLDDIQLERKAVYRFHARTVETFGKGRVFLAGDAAHITPPFVGQGLVAGLRDAANLGWKLAWVVKGRAAPDILDSYDAERRPHVKAMIDFARFMGRLVMPRNAVAALLIHGIMRLTRFVPILRRRFDEQEMKPKNVFRRGLFIADRTGRTGSKLQRGGVVPQGWMRNAAGQICLSDDVFGSGLALIGFGVDAGQTLDAGLAAAFASAGGSIVQVMHRGQRLHRAEAGGWEDLDGVFLPRSVPFGWVAIVRPDRVLIHDGPASEVNRLVAQSLAILGATAGVAAPSPGACLHTV
ncbi:bifunctional 3-(3-hydroxy-phenyl)propionate/3-hydroxycinnamic acid hydroxylase [Paraburkholderia sp. J12]|uniref:bifunctional 3-(3-hydroxy-phenyl)propionate/3-hydroxycinnamic acid hydroxylase n=1 Tax=Paraburkholderia sp. J12 TaxID=2805432 RepID=UPI002ABD9604|nr:bifunctional 3-(3-hydroxy-phenyl)propionate/3-hydroxycinnamic acid hydroxylase [Paraburkholderia sp. J12]